MRQELEQALYEELKGEVEAIGGMKLGEDEHVKTAQVVNTTLDRLNEIKKIENEGIKLEMEAERLRIEDEKLELEHKKHRFDKVMGVVKIVGAGIGLGVTTLVTIWANQNAQEFEKDYTHTTKGGQESSKKLLNLVDNFVKKLV